jgi:hypothetical protein
MFTCNGEPHGIRKRSNQADFTRRMQEFFDGRLNGAPMPEWMSEGIPFVDKDKEEERYRAVTVDPVKKDR